MLVWMRFSAFCSEPSSLPVKVHETLSLPEEAEESSSSSNSFSSAASSSSSMRAPTVLGAPFLAGAAVFEAEVESRGVSTETPKSDRSWRKNCGVAMRA